MLKAWSSQCLARSKYRGPYKIGLRCFLFFLIYFSERQSTSGGGAEREGGTESEAGSRRRAVSPEPDAGLEPTNREIMT